MATHKDMHGRLWVKANPDRWEYKITERKGGPVVRGVVIHNSFEVWEWEFGNRRGWEDSVTRAMDAARGDYPDTIEVKR